MQETKLHSDLLDVIQANNGLKMYLRGLAQGREATPRSSLYALPGKTELLEPDEILARWKQQLDRLEGGSSYDREVFHFDSSQLEKWGPQGEIAPMDDLLESIVYPTFSSSGKTTAFSTRKWQLAKRIVAQQLHHAGAVSLRPVSYPSVIDDMRARDTLESNSGWPLFTRRNKPEVIEQSIKEAENGLWKTYPAIALFRNYNRKTRLVWMFPMSANLVEGSFSQPLQRKLILTARDSDAYFLDPWVGFEKVRYHVTNIFESKAGVRELFMASSDFSSTDAHFRLAASMEVCDVLETCFQPRYRELLRDSIQYMHNIPLIVSADTMLVGEHGVSSGSNWTNFIETIFDWILTYYVSFNEDDVLPNEGYAIGDDMAWVMHAYDASFPERLEKYGESVGQQIKAEKTGFDRDKLKSLQRLFVRNQYRSDGQLRAVYPTIRALKSLVYPERFHKPELWSKDMEAVRAFMILENCVDHPLFEEFCLFVAAGDPNLRTVARETTRRQDILLRQSKLVPGLNPTYNQEKRDQSLSTFESVKFLRTH